MLEDKKTKLVVAPAINWLVATLNEAEMFGYSHEQAEKTGYQRELDAAIAGLREMHRRGIVVLPGGDYGFAVSGSEAISCNSNTYMSSGRLMVHTLAISNTLSVYSASASMKPLSQLPVGLPSCS